MQSMYIKPKAGLIIRDPDTYEILPPAGAEKPQSSYWLRHLQSGDVVLVESTAETPKKGVKK